MQTIRETHKRILAAQKLLSGSTTAEKFSAVRKLIKGIRPELDEALERCEQQFSTIGNLMQGDMLSLTAEKLPEVTEEEKKRKKALLFFIDTWSKLKSEVSRVERELAAADSSSDRSQKQSHWGNILKHAAGPLGLVTAIAIGLVLLKTTSVEVLIQNKGCGTLEVSSSLPPLPGFALPSGPIADGDSGSATLPPLTLDVDGTKAGAVLLKTFTFTLSFELPSSVSDLSMDGKSLLHKKSVIRLSDSKQHTLTLSCS